MSESRAPYAADAAAPGLVAYDDELFMPHIRAVCRDTRHQNTAYLVWQAVPNNAPGQVELRAYRAAVARNLAAVDALIAAIEEKCSK